METSEVHSQAMGYTSLQVSHSPVGSLESSHLPSWALRKVPRDGVWQLSHICPCSVLTSSKKLHYLKVGSNNDLALA